MSSDMDFNTPMRGVQEKEPSQTGIKKESEISQNGQREEEVDPAQQIDNLEKKIYDIQDNLRAINIKKSSFDECSEEYAELEEERRVLRHQLVDLDYQHKQAFKRFKQDNLERQRKRWEAIQRKIQEEREERAKELERVESERLERSKRAYEELAKIEEEAKQRREKIAQEQTEKEEISKEVYRGEAEIKITESKLVSGGGEETEKKEVSAEEKLAESRHKARVAEIEAELASERLRRSRQLELQSELLRLRSQTPLISSLYRYSPLYRYPYYLDPFYSRLTYPLYPYI